jgi:hypothetical protein
MNSQVPLADTGVFPLIGSAVQYPALSQLMFHHPIQVRQKVELALAMVLPGAFHDKFLAFYLQIVLDSLLNALLEAPGSLCLSVHHGPRDCQ